MSAIDDRERLIAALDVPSAQQARALAGRLGEAVRFYKIGLELFTAGGYFELLEWLGARGGKVFADLKLYDIPETVRRAVANLRASGASFLTVHAERSIMEAAAREKGELKILAVTVLTSFDARSIAEMGYAGSVEDLVLKRARAALESGPCTFYYLIDGPSCFLTLTEKARACVWGVRAPVWGLSAAARQQLASAAPHT